MPEMQILIGLRWLLHNRCRPTDGRPVTAQPDSSAQDGGAAQNSNQGA